MSRRKKPTLFSRKGKLWLEGKELLPIFPRKNEKDSVVDDILNMFQEAYDNEIKKRKIREYATIEDVQRLDRRVDYLESELKKITLFKKSNGIEASVECLLSKVADWKEIKRIFLKNEGNYVDFFVKSDELNNNLLEKISQIEIDISRLFPRLSVNIELIACEEEIPEGSRLVLVKN